MTDRTIKTPGAIVRIEGNTVTKHYYSSNKSLYENEVHWLRSLPPTRFIPELLESSDSRLSISTRYAGEPISANNLPADWGQQIEEILSALKVVDCEHSDLLPQNILVEDGELRIVDFAFARKISEPPPSHKQRVFCDSYTRTRLHYFLHGMPNNTEVHAFTVWDANHAAAIERELKKSLTVIDKIFFSPLLYTEYYQDRITWLEAFYRTNNTYGAKKGSKPFCCFVVLSQKPVYESRGRVFDSGVSTVNTEIFDLKVRLRGGYKNYLHATDNLEEARRNLRYLSRNDRSFPFSYAELSRPRFESIREIFDRLNSLDGTSYVLLRAPTDRGGDFDILCDDYFVVKRALGGVAYKRHSKFMFRTVGDPVDEGGFKVANYVKLNDEKIRFDIRYVGDGYYPRKWQQKMLRNRVLRDGIYVCSKEDEFYGKAYHALFQKLKLPDKYRDHFVRELDINEDSVEAELRKRVLEFLERNEYPITRPKDLTIPYNPPNKSQYATRREYFYIRTEVRKRNFSGASKILTNHFLLEGRRYKWRFYSWLAYILYKKTEGGATRNLRRFKRRVQFKLDRSVRYRVLPYLSRSA